MTWVRIDDAMPRNRKIRSLSARAFQLHIFAICYCSEHLTDGYLTTAEVRELGATAKQISELSTSNYPEFSPLWEQVRGGFLIHDYLDYNPSREDVNRDRERARERQRRRRHGVTPPVTPPVTTTVSHRTPSRPVPISTPTVLVDPGGDSPGKQILPKRLQQILQDSIRDALTQSQAETVAAAWNTNDYELRQSMRQVEQAGNPAAYLVQVARRIGGTTNA